MKTIITFILLLFTTITFAQNSFNFDKEITTNQNKIINHLNYDAKINSEKAIKYQELLNEYYSLKNYRKGHNTSVGFATATSPAIIPAIGLDIVLFVITFGGQTEMSAVRPFYFTRGMGDWWGNIGKHKNEIKTKKNKVLSLYNSLN